MCKKNFKSGDKRIDPCLRDYINSLKSAESKNTKVVACCCGHKKYHKTIIVKSYEKIWDLCSVITIPRKKRFYVKDKQGYYYIPEVEEFYKKARK